MSLRAQPKIANSDVTTPTAVTGSVKNMAMQVIHKTQVVGLLLWPYNYR